MQASLFATIRVVFEGPLILVMLVLESHVGLDPTWTWSSTIIYAGGNIGVISLSFMVRVRCHFEGGITWGCRCYWSICIRDHQQAIKSTRCCQYFWVGSAAPNWNYDCSLCAWLWPSLVLHSCSISKSGVYFYYCWSRHWYSSFTQGHPRRIWSTSRNCFIPFCPRVSAGMGLFRLHAFHFWVRRIFCKEILGLKRAWIL